MSALPLTSTLSPGLRASPLYPLKRLLAERQLSLVLVGVAFLALLTGIGGILLAIDRLQAPQLLYVLDAAGNVTVGPVENLRKGSNSALFTTIATQVTLQFFSRGPGGLDFPELAERYFTTACFAKVLNEVQAGRAAMVAKDMRFKPEVTSLDLSVPTDPEGRRIIRVSGFYTVSGVVDGMQLPNEKQNFVLSIAIIPNPDFSSRGMFPFVASAYKVAYQ